MKRSTWIAVILAAAIGWIAPGCGDDDDSGGDGGPSDTDDDADAGVDCAEQPTACEDIGEDADAQLFGCCFDNTVYWCDTGELYNSDCDTAGAVCDYNASQDAMWCM